jgi:hypothetical protein
VLQRIVSDLDSHAGRFIAVDVLDLFLQGMKVDEIAFKGKRGFVALTWTRPKSRGMSPDFLGPRGRLSLI